MNRTIRIALSVASGALAIFLSLSYASSVRSEADRVQADALARYGGDLVSVCVATRTIEPGETLDETNVQVKEWVASLLPQGAATSLRDVAGTRVTSRVPSHAVLCPVYTETSGETLDVPSGKVAVSVPVDDQHALGGAVESGDTVDVYVSKDGLSDRLCEARIIDTSSRDSSADTAMKWATLAVDPDTVKELLAAIARGSVSLTMPAPSTDAKASATSGGGRS
ncbi:Flp pilus assembly protein CpaB [Coriobacterium glomerans PW2]|uniref:Flp pilus assembly protein CpaB n=1 Tax=Coriobacterium glomerans (strain ATCC 49209 / DSM 20642 / JCM 10262 / PW2) TaxID=700015 RepID=F2NA62_CORGP|nr:Flp pilus assembly protein CpaB [Coriobacterium glomerans]AEB06456.1 Flp pilus assembly protein CpaB [Coriobacterium glomerans PW2]